MTNVKSEREIFILARAAARNPSRDRTTLLRKKHLRIVGVESGVLKICVLAGKEVSDGIALHSEGEGNFWVLWRKT